MDTSYQPSNPRLWAVALVAGVVACLLKLRRGVQSVGYLPGYRVPFAPCTPLSAIIGTRWWNPGLFFPWVWRGSLYTSRDTISIIPFIFGVPTVYTSNMEVMRQVVAAQRWKYIKTEKMTSAVRPFGENLLAAEGDVWRKHRRIVGPAFNSELYKLVWAQSLLTYHEMQIAEGWDHQDVVEVGAVQKLTAKFTLLIIARCGFGFNFDWSAPPVTVDGEASIQEMFSRVTDNHILLSVAPKWVFRIPFFGLAQLGQCHTQLERFMHSQIAERRAELGGQTSTKRGDVFTALIKANAAEESKYRLDDSELVGNVYILLLAGYESTSHALDATLAYLASHQDIQSELYDQIVSVLGFDKDPVVDHYPLLDKVLAAFVESIRLYPPAYIMIRDTYEPGLITAPNPFSPGQTQTILLPEGGQLVIDIIGLLRNPHNFEEPESYKPSRWYGALNEAENILAFSSGPRTCVGKKFGTTEAVCFLSSLLRDWRVEPLLRGGETQDDWRGRVIQAKFGVTLGLKDVPLRFVRRRKA